MKRLFTYILLCIFSASLYADDYVMYVFLNDGTFRGFYQDEIDSISYSHFDLDSVWHEEMVVQDVWRKDSVDRISLSMIDSISYSLPENKYKSEVIRLDERYLPYILSHDDMTISFSSNLPDYLRPKEGNVLLYEGSNNIFPNGFAGTVTKLVDGVAICDSASMDDVYEKMYFFGSYVLAENGDGTGGYSAKQIHSKRSDDEWEDWGIFEVNPTNIPFDKLKMAEKIEIPSANLFASVSGTVTPTTTIQASFVANVFEPLVYFQATTRLEYDALLQVGFNKDFTPKHRKDIEKPFRTHTIGKKPDQESEFHAYLIDKVIPIPQCPILNVGIKVGFFLAPKVEAEAVLGLHIKASEDKTHIFRMDKNNIDQLGEWFKFNGPEPETFSVEPEFEGTLTGSVWGGVTAAINYGIGTDKSGIKGETRVRIGPYIEGKLNLDILDLNKDMSWYSGLKDSKLKRGIKTAFNLCDFTVKIPKVFNYKWPILEVSPQKLWKEQECYLLPAFEAPTYSVNGNSLKCYTSVTRSTVPNHIGFRVKDELGKEETKWQDFTFDFGDEEHPYVISETFENLDFKNHRYTIIPVTRIWELPALEIPEPEQTCVTCPDSKHPHLIDLGLPSGTKWLCSNVYAEKPQEAGGYYQWGNAYKTMSYDDTYTIPSIDGDNFQGTSCDAATANIGEEFVTPTAAQFDELLTSCQKTIKYSNWLKKEGVYLKGPNGAILYLPFSGYMDAKEVKSESNGYYVVANRGKDGVDNPVLSFEKTDDSFSHWGYSSAKWYGYSVRPVSKQNATAFLISTEAITLSAYSIGSVQITSGSGSYSIESVVPSGIVTAEISDNSIAIEAHKAGTAIITVKDTKSGQTATIEVTVIDSSEIPTYLTCPDGNHPHLIDLGLPSGTKWSCCNVGAHAPEDYGGYYAWGESKEKDYYTWTTYTHCDGSSSTCHDIGNDISGTQYDVAHVEWGGKWCMPTLEQFEELKNNTTWKWTVQDGINGLGITSSNGGKLFLPAAGCHWGNGIYNEKTDGAYWFSTLYKGYNDCGYYLRFNKDNTLWDYYCYRYFGQSVRPVVVDK